MIEIYTTNACSYCVAAKKLLDEKRIPYKEHIIGIHIMREKFLEMFPTAKTVPQIVEDGIRIGGYVDLVEHLNNPPELSEELLQG